MPLADIVSVVSDARAAGRGVGAFNVVLLDHGEQFVQAAQTAGLPVILQFSQNAVKYHGGQLKPMGHALLELAKAATVPVVVHLDHADDIALCKEAVDMGFTSVMFDGSHLPDDENRRATRIVADYCHAANVGIEAELGEVGGKNGVHDPSARTQPDAAAQFVADTSVDLLAVAVGSSHAMTTRDAALDTKLIADIASTVPVPLVLHGSSGVSDAGMTAAITAGMTKINVSTHLNVLFTAAVRTFLDDHPDVVDPRKYCAPGNDVIRQEVERLLRLYAAI